MSDYTPTTDQVRARYIAACSYNSTVPPGVNLGADILHEEVLYQAILGNGDNDETL